MFRDAACKLDGSKEGERGELSGGSGEKKKINFAFRGRKREGELCTVLHSLHAGKQSKQASNHASTHLLRSNCALLLYLSGFPSPCNHVFPFSAIEGEDEGACMYVCV